MEQRTDEIASKFLGKKVDGSKFYDPSLIVVVPREDNRKQYNINNSYLPFYGFDAWHCYEFSSMTENNVPVTRLMKLKYSCENDYIIESKSLKLYLNSFNMSCFGKTTLECLDICKLKIESDLSEKLKTEVNVCFIDNSAERIEIFNDFKNIMEYVDESTLKINSFKESPEVLKISKTEESKTYYLMFDSLRSNCRVTHQPDFGDVYIYYKSKKHIDENSLVQYLTSFRSEYHFHEECCEMIYKRLFDLLTPQDELFVCALYTRRGGIDICPARWSKNCIYKDVFNLMDVTKYARKPIKQ